MIQMTPQMRVFVATEPVDGRKAINGLVMLCQKCLCEDPFSGGVFIFRSRSGHSRKILAYDGNGFRLAQKRLSKGRFNNWPKSQGPHSRLRAHQVYALCMGGDPGARGAPDWRPLPLG